MIRDSAYERQTMHTQAELSPTEEPTIALWLR